MKLISASSYYGLKQYDHPLCLFPPFAGDAEGVKQALIRIHPGSIHRIEDLRTSNYEAIPGVCGPGIIYHTDDWSIQVIYEGSNERRFDEQISMDLMRGLQRYRRAQSLTVLDSHKWWVEWEASLTYNDCRVRGNHMLAQDRKFNP